jgi:hypothetical protein
MKVSGRFVALFEKLDMAAVASSHLPGGLTSAGAFRSTPGSMYYERRALRGST